MIESPPFLREAIQSGATLILNATAINPSESCHLDALEQDGSGPDAKYRPVLFTRREKVTAEDRLILAFAASFLTHMQGSPPANGKVIHGSGFKASRVELATLADPVRERVSEIQGFLEAAKPPPLVLNRHCAECEFRQRCRAAAVEKDDLSLLGGLSPKEVAGLNARGIFTVTQYAYTFRPEG